MKTTMTVGLFIHLGSKYFYINNKKDNSYSKILSLWIFCFHYRAAIKSDFVAKKMQAMHCVFVMLLCNVMNGVVTVLHLKHDKILKHTI